MKSEVWNKEDGYGEWSAMASEARLKYAHKEITAEEFLQRIDTMHDLTSYKIKECKLVPEHSKWQQCVADNIAFDPERAFPETMMFLDLEKGKPQWESYTSEQLQKKAGIARYRCFFTYFHISVLPISK